MILTIIATVRLWHLFAFVARTHKIAVLLSRDGLNFIYSIYACKLTLPVNIQSVQESEQFSYQHVHQSGQTCH